MEGGRVSHSWCMCVVVMATMTSVVVCGSQTKPGGWSYVGRCRSISRVCGEYTDYTRSYHHPDAQFRVGSSRNWSVFLERPDTGRHEKAPVRCPCSRLAALHGAPRTRGLSSFAPL